MGNNKPVEKKRKKKGRPSLLDLQKRSLRLQKQQQQQQQQQRNPNPSPNPYLRFPNPASVRRITRRNPHSEADPDPEDDDEDDEDPTGNRREKKLKLVLRLPHGPANSVAGTSDSGPSGSEADGNGGGGRKIGHGDRDKPERRNSLKATDQATGVPSDSGPTTPLPDKKLLVFILDRLQKKDTYGVFSEPVDPKELPDYHEVIKRPMDFATVRKKLSSGAYANLEQFETDIFLISSNAMRYNSPDTIYYRQARSIQELAKKDFENLRQESDDNESEPKTVARRGRPPSKIPAKRAVGRPAERAASDFSSDATLANANDNTHWSSLNHDLSRRGSAASEKPGTAGVSTRASLGLRNNGTFGWMGEHKAEKNEEYSGSALWGIPTRYGKKPLGPLVIDENRRNTYKQPQPSTCVREPPLLSTFDGGKQLVPVGLHMEHAYARSLARFAANFGPVGWAIAARKIERALPPGTKFGPGWVGDSEAPPQSQPPLISMSPPRPTSLPHISPCTTISRSDGLPERMEPPPPPPPNDSTVEGGHFSRTLPPPASAASGRSSDAVESSELRNGSNLLGGGGGNNQSKAPFQLHRNPGMQPAANGFSTPFGLNLASQLGKMIRPSNPSSFGPDTPMTHGRVLDMVSRGGNSFIHQTPMGQAGQLDPEKVKLAGSSSTIGFGGPARDPWHDSQGALRGLSLQPKPDSVPPDLNVRFQSPGSPASGVMVDSQQPDLALQL